VNQLLRKEPLFIFCFLQNRNKEFQIFYFSSPKGSFNNDLAILKIQRKGDGTGIQLSSSVAPACLPLDDTPQKAGTECTVSGWGKIDGEFLKNITGGKMHECMNDSHPILDHI
jgi:hypothetical protein